MKLFKFFTATLVLISGLVANAADKVCICETGTFPQSQVTFFVAGCKAWLSSQNNCAVKKMIPHYEGRTTYASYAAQGYDLSVGYVGHWSSSNQLVGYLRSEIQPALEAGKGSIEIDNTACSSMSNPEEVSQYLQSLNIEPNRKIDIKGNQIVSVGMWDKFIPSRLNFWARVNKQNNQTSVEYPKCRQFEGSNCLQGMQEGQPSTCVRGDTQVKLYCCKTKKNPYSTISSSGSYLWAEQQFCSK